MLDLGHRGYQPTVLHSLGGDEFASDLMDFISAATDYYYFETVMLVQVDVQTGVHGNFGFVLHLRQKIAQPVYPVVVDEGDNAEDRKSTRLNSSHIQKSRMPSSA